ncbi:MAG: hypothetical protein WC421_04295 [Elusimicrobiales bacterium]
MRRLLAFALVCAAITALFAFILESRIPYYFLQDDNRDISLPYFVHAFRALRAGELAQFNFHQFLGAPAAMMPCPAGLPAVWLSNALLGHFWGAVDLLAFAWMYLSGMGFFVFASSMGLGLWPAAFGAAAWMTCPFVILTQTCWWMVGPAAAFFPFMAYGAYRIYSRGDGKGFFALFCASAALAWVDNPEYLLRSFAVLPVFMAAVILADEISANSAALLAWRGGGARRIAEDAWRALVFLACRHRGTLLLCVCAAALGVLSAAPNFLLLLEKISLAGSRAHGMSLPEFAKNSLPAAQWLKGIVWPWSRHFPGWRETYSMDAMSYLGYIIPPLAVLALVRARRNGAAAVCAVFGALALGCLLWSAGAFNFYEWRLPGLRLLHCHFRALIFANLFICVLAAFGLEFLSRRAAHAALALHLLNMAVFFGAGPYASFRLYTDKIPAREPRAAMLSTGRILTLGYRPCETDAMPPLGFDYATLFGLYHFAGYDTLRALKNDWICFGLNVSSYWEEPLSEQRLLVLRVWGVRWYVLPDTALGRYGRFFAEHGIRPAARDGRRLIYEDARALPMVFREGETAPAGDCAFSANRLKVRLRSPSAGGNYVVNILYNPHFRAWDANGEPLELSEYKSWQTLVHVKEGAGEFSLEYSTPGLALAAALAAGALAAAIAAALLLK